MDKQSKYLELWGDLVSMKDILIAFALSAVLTMGGYFLAPAGDTTRQLFYGLGGAVLATLINTTIIKPKREIIRQDASGESE